MLGHLFLKFLSMTYEFNTMIVRIILTIIFIFVNQSYMLFFHLSGIFMIFNGLLNKLVNQVTLASPERFQMSIGILSSPTTLSIFIFL